MTATAAPQSAATSASARADASTTSTAWWALAPEEALAQEGSDATRGLTDAEVASRREKFGPNAFTSAKKESRLAAFARQYQDGMQIVLLVAGIVCLFLPGQIPTGIVLMGLTLFNAALGLNQEGKAEASVSALQKMMVVKAKVIRNGNLAEVPMEQLVPGDIVNVEAGDLVPADGRVLHAATLEVDESALTGESLPVPKQVESVAADAALGDRIDMTFMNTQVTRGSGTIVVTTTGMGTEVGHISGMLASTTAESTPLTQQLAVLTNQILVIAGVALVASIGIGLARGQSFQTLFLTAVAFAVSAIPTGLPAVVTAVLSAGTTTLAKAGAIVKRLKSVETLGSTSAINSDKTGTLTLNQMTAVQMTIGGRRYAVSGEGYSIEGKITHVGGQPDVSLDEYMLPMALCADAVVDASGEVIGDPTELALVVLAAKGGTDPKLTREQYPRVAVLPFDAAYKLMATFHRMTDASGKDVIRAYVKGAPDQLLGRAANGRSPGAADVPVAEFKDRYLAENTRLAEQGLRVMATAQREFDPATFDANGDLLALMDNLTLLALVGIVDPPRPAAKASIATARHAGIRVRMITGDHAVTAQAIASDLGIEGRAITGAEWAAMSDAEAERQIDGIGVIARVTPEHKVRLVDVLKRKGNVVAMTGDGVNDAPALKRADIGVAMGITGTEVSKQAAVMILTDDNFATIVKAVELGRALYDNLLRYIRFQMAGLFGFITAFLGASIFNILGGIPFLPLQTLWINFTVTVFQAIGLGFGQPRPGLMDDPPRPKGAALLPRRLMAWLVIVGVLMGGITLVVIQYANNTYGEAVAHSMGLVAFSLINIAFSLETVNEDRTIFSSELLENPMLLKVSALSLVATIAATEIGLLQRILDTVSLSLEQWGICVLAAALIIVVCEIKKLLRIDVGSATSQPAPVPVTAPAA